MRTKQQHEYAYQGLTTREFGERIGQSVHAVRALVAAGWFGWTKEGMPECMDISSPGAKCPTWRIHKSAVQRYYQERAAPQKGAA